jgi:hypothetical protein
MPMQKPSAQQIRGLVVDGLFLAGLGLYGWGLWRWVPEAAPALLGGSLVILAGALHVIGSRSA